MTGGGSHPHIDRSFSIQTEPCFSWQPASKEAGHNQFMSLQVLPCLEILSMLRFALHLSFQCLAFLWFDPPHFWCSRVSFIDKKVLLGGFICSSVQSVKGLLLTPADAGWNLQRLLLHYLWRLLHRVHSLQAFQSFWIFPASAFQITKCVLLKKKKNKIKMVPINHPGSLHYIKVQANT